MDNYVYEPIDLERPAFRLLQLLRGKGPAIECILYQAYLDGTDTVPYDALSYTWGGTNKTSTVTVNGKTLGVTENLYSALQHLRLKDVDRVLWVDAICIDQSNEKERGHQVQQMCKIYSHAEEVVVWLGQPTKETDALMDSLRQLEKDSLMYVHRHWDLAQWTILWQLVPQNPDFGPLQGLDMLLRRPWFQRVWILQEIANAKKASVRCGIKSVKAHTFALAPSLMGIKPERHCQAVLDIMPGHLREETWWGESRDLYNLLLKFRESNASDPRDQVYALLGISSDACDTDVLRPAYTKDIQAVIRDTSLFLFGQSDVSYETMPEFLEDLTFRNSTSFSEFVRTYSVSEVERFLVRRGLEVPLSEDMLKATAENRENGREIMSFLIQKRGSEITVTDGVIEAAARNKRSGRDIIILLFQRHEVEFELTQQALKMMQDALSEDFGEMLASLLEGIAVVDMGNYYSGKLLCMMSEGGYKAAVKLLLDKGVSPNGQGQGHSVTFQMSHRGHRAVVELLLDNYTNNDSVYIYRRNTALYAASAGGHKAVVKLLLDKGADVNATKGFPNTALCGASAEGHEAVVKLLLDRGADVNATSRVHQTALYAASARGHEAVVKLLLDRGADVNAGGEFYQKPLYEASAGGHEAVVKLLLDRGADVNAASRVHKTALYAASSGGHEAVVKLLLDRGADVNAGDEFHQKPLYEASAGGHEAVVKLLLDRGADVNAGDEFYQKPLYKASFRGHEAVVKLLLDRGADVNAGDEFYQKPLYEASFRGHEAVVKLLLDRGADINARNDFYNTLLYGASSGGHEAVVELLRRKKQEQPI
ncbi:ankyrin repeat-containing domain protein [Bipolaris maydis]|nr:ankyrin repeat-containing domain protein [Bipolaris maydis]KAJ5058805.1 ankyrin repeat-containing domain protein [Bipolaris maydis]KAJ6208791.1 ankyrin repeat-containing domain protein [Bipolaris maydis]KAJ6270689.1 ankyrin repeat-containing domain protein [Bipolaris maydis]